MSPASKVLLCVFGLVLALPGFSQAVPAPASSAAAAPADQTASKADALLLYRQGRDLESAGKTAEAGNLYTQAISICDTELAGDPKRMDAYAVKCWCLFRLNRHQEVVDIGGTALKILFDARIAEVMGESYYYLGRNDLALKSFQKYLESGQYPDRVSTAYFYIGETYLRMKKWSHADIAYTTAVRREPGMSRWWYRLGQVCENLGDWQRSADAYTRALSLSPGLQEATDGLARVKPKIGT
jgi:tetratricopeptide (TPR) repeat protein